MTDDEHWKSAMLAKVAEDIHRVGHSVMGIFPDKEEKKPGFFYTVGRHQKNLPELLMVVNLAGPQGMDILNALSRAQPFTHGQLVDLGGKYPVLIIDATKPIVQKEYTRMVNAFYNTHDYQVQQVLLPDPNGRFPPDGLKPYRDQPILGEMPWTPQLSNI